MNKKKKKIGMKSLFSLLVLFLVGVQKFTYCASQSIIETLPGYAGPLPFKLETGYIGVGENEEVQLFYYFVQSENDPSRDPLVLWLTGGPGCSAFSGLVYEIGPLGFDVENFDGSLPNFTINPYSWTKAANIIFLDSPVGTGFSYSNTSQGYVTSDIKATQHNYSFLRKWLLIHPTFLKNRLFIAGDSYAGKIVAMVALDIAKGNEAGLEPKMSLKGYIIGNSLTNRNWDENERIPYAHRVALISDQYFQLARSSCGGEYVNPDPNNILCLYALRLIQECTSNLYTAHILEPNCLYISPKPSGHKWGQLFIEDPSNLILQSKLKCRNQNYVTSYVWANDENVQESLHIRKGTISYWIRCNQSLGGYEEDQESVFEHHRLLNEKGFQALVYSGDHDFIIPYMSTLKWIRKLNITLDEEWRPWMVDGQVAGYTEKYKNKQAYITFATVKGAGHTAPEYKPKECLAMLERWLSLYPL